MRCELVVHGRRTAHVILNSDPKPNLSHGDVVALLGQDDDVPYAANAYADDAGGGGARYRFEQCRSLARDDFASSVGLHAPTTHLEIVRRPGGEFWGFRSRAAGGKMLQATRKARRRLVFASSHFGTWEEWILLPGVSEDLSSPWTTRDLVFKNRRVDGVRLRVTALRVGTAIDPDLGGVSTATSLANSPTRTSSAFDDSIVSTTRSVTGRGDAGPEDPTLSFLREEDDTLDDTDDGRLPSAPGSPAEFFSPTAEPSSSSDPSPSRGARVPQDRPPPNAFRRPLFAEGGSGPGSRPGSRPGSTRASPSGRAIADASFASSSAGGDGSREHASALRAMGGVVAKEFVAALTKEVAARAAIEKEVLRLHSSSEELREWALAELDLLRAYSREHVEELARTIEDHRVNAALADASLANAEGANEELKASTRRLLTVVEHRAIYACGVFARRRERHVTARCFDAWWSVHADVQRKNTLLRRIGARLGNVALARALDGWRGAAADRIALRRRTRLHVMRWSHVLESSAFRAWASTSRSEIMRRRAIAATTRRNRRRTTEPAFHRWRLRVHSIRATRERTAVDDATKMARMNAQRRGFEYIATKRLRRMAYDAMWAWSDQASRQRRTRRVHTRNAMRFDARATRRFLSKVLTGWQNVASRDRFVRRVVEQRRARVGRAIYRGAFARWANWANLSASRRKLVSLIFARNVIRAIDLAWRAWKKTCDDERARRQRIMTHAAGRLVRGPATTCFVSWRVRVMEKQQKRALASKVVKRWSRRLAFSAFRSWFLCARRARRDRRVVARFRARATSRDLAYAFDGFRAGATRRKRLRALSVNAAARMRHECLSRAFYGWEASASEAARARRRARRATEFAARKTRERTAAAWAEAARETKRERALATRAASKAYRWTRWRAFNAWATRVTDERRKREFLRKHATRVTKRHLAAGFATWGEKTRENTKKRSLMRRYVEKMSQRELRRAINGWLTHHDAAVSAKNLERRAALRMRRRRASRAFNSWVFIAERSRDARRFARRAVSKLRARVTADAFDRWLLHVDAAARRAAQMDRVVARWTHLRHARVVAGWRVAAATRRRHRTIASRVIARMSRATLARAFASWRDDAARFRKFKSLCFKVANARLASAFNAWRADADAARATWRATRKADAMRARGERRVVATALFAWRAEHEKLAHAKRIIRNHVARITANVARECVKTWIDVVEKKKAEVANLKKCLTRKRVAQKWFLRWYWDAFDNDIQDALANILGTTESTMNDVYSSPAGPGGAPSAIRGMMAIGARGGFSDSDDDDDDGDPGGGGGSDSSDDSDDYSDRGESSGGVNRHRLGDVDDADDIAEAADALFASRAHGVTFDPKNAGDVRKARRMMRQAAAKSASVTKEKPGDAAAGAGKKKKKERTPPTRPTREPAAVTKPRVDAESSSSAAAAVDAEADAWLDSPNDDDVDASGGAVKDARNAPAASDEVEPFNARIERVLEEEKNVRTKAGGDFFGFL